MLTCSVWCELKFCPYAMISLTSSLCRQVRETYGKFITQNAYCSLTKMHGTNHEDPCTFVKVIVKKMRGTFLYLDTVRKKIERSRNMRPGRALKKAKKKERKKLRDVTSHTFAQTTHVVLPPPSCGVKSRT